MRHRWYRYAAWVPLPFLAGAVAQQYALSNVRSATAAIGLAQPLPVVTNWGAYGATALLPLVAAVALACVPYTLAVRSARSSAASTRAVTIVVAIGCAAIVASWCWKAIFSSDVYAYATYGDLALRGFDPYAHGVIPHPDALARAAAFQWGNPPPRAVYGPLFVGAAAVVVWITRGDVAGALWGLRGVELAAYLAAVIAYAAALRAWHHAKALAATCALALNPLVLWTIAEGHNDVASFAFAAFALALALRAPLGAGALSAAAMAVKATGVLSALVALPLLRRRGTAWRPVLGGAVGGLTLMAMGYALFLRAPAISESVPPAAHGNFGGGTIAWLMSVALHPIVPIDATMLIVACAIVAGIASIAVAALLKRRRRDRAWIGIAVIGVLYSLPQLYPWYALWTIAVASIALDTAGIAAIATSTATVVLYAPDAIERTNVFLVVPVAMLTALPLLIGAIFVRTQTCRESLQPNVFPKIAP